MEIRDAVPGDRGFLEALTLARNPHTEPWVMDTVFADAMTLDAFVVAEEDGAPTGWAFTGLVPGTPEHLRSAFVLVGPEHEGRGVGRALFAHVLAAVPRAGTELRSRVFHGDERGLAVARHWGFEVTQLSINSALELVAGPGPVPPAGIVLEDADDLSFPDEAEVDAMFAASQTNPEATNHHRMDLAEMRSYRFPGERGLACVARVDGVPAALCYVIVGADGEEGGVVYTGVDPRFRGRGLGRLVKLQVQARAQALGVRRLVTENEEHNDGIRRLNAEMGFVVRWGVYRIGKVLRPAAPAPG